MPLLDRYFLFKVIPTMILTLMVAAVILMLDKLLTLLNLTIGNGVSALIAIKMMFTLVPNYLRLVLPLGLFLGAGCGGRRSGRGLDLVGPGRLQPGGVDGGDGLQRGIAHAAGVVAVGGPVARAGRLGRPPRAQRQEEPAGRQPPLSLNAHMHLPARQPVAGRWAAMYELVRFGQQGSRDDSNIVRTGVFTSPKRSVIDGGRRLRLPRPRRDTNEAGGIERCPSWSTC